MDAPKFQKPRPEAEKADKAEQKAQKASTSAEATKTTRVNSLEEVDQMTDEAVKEARLSGASRKRMKALIEGGLDYIAAKKAVIKENFTKSRKTTEEKATKRPRSESTTPPSKPAVKKAKKETFKDALTGEKVAVVMEGYPAEQMEPEKQKAAQKAIVAAYEGISEGGPQVRFSGCTHRPGYLVVSCADGVSAEWLAGVVPTLRPWEGASLRTLAGGELPRPVACTVFVPDEDGQRLDSSRILHRLKISQQELNTHLWKVWGTTQMDKGQMWTFSMDKESLEELKRVGMNPYFGMGRLKFREKGQGNQQEEQRAEKKRPEASTSKDAGTSGFQKKTGKGTPRKASEGTPRRSGTDPVARPSEATRRGVTPMEVEEAAGGTKPQGESSS